MYDIEFVQSYASSCPESFERARRVLFDVRQEELAVLFSLMGIVMENEYRITDLSEPEVAA
jgi:hypothetical protein